MPASTIATALNSKTMLAKVKPETSFPTLTACERNMQVNCINQFGTVEYLKGTKESPCNIRKLTNCLNVEKAKRECRVNDYGTVYYIEAFLRNVNVNKCMDDFDFYEVHQLFQAPSPKNVHEFSNTHRTLSSGDHDAVPYHPNDNEIDDDDDDHEGGESGSGQT